MSDYSCSLIGPTGYTGYGYTGSISREAVTEDKANLVKIENISTGHVVLSDIQIRVEKGTSCYITNAEYNKSKDILAAQSHNLIRLSGNLTRNIVVEDMKTCSGCGSPIESYKCKYCGRIHTSAYNETSTEYQKYWDQVYKQSRESQVNTLSLLKAMGLDLTEQPKKKGFFRRCTESLGPK
jgi:hypothetical protein